MTEDSAVGRVLVLARYFEPAFRGGGPIQTLGALIRATPKTIRVAIACSNEDLGDSTPLVTTPDKWLVRDGFDVSYLRRRPWSLFTALTAALKTRPQLVYLNSLFDPVYSLFPQLLSVLGLLRGARILLAPRGELNEGALALRATKKSALLFAYRASGFHRRVLWHASTQEEAQDIRRVFGNSLSILVKEDETSLAPTARQREARRPGACRLVFASRAVPKKGLLTVLKSLACESGPVELEIVGAFEEADYEAACKRVIDTLPANILVNRRGALPRSELIQRLGEADLMVFPTAGENFGHVIAEALSVSCPVMCSAATPWTRRLASGAGVVVVPNSVEAWSAAIHEFIAQGAEGWSRYSNRAAVVFEEWRNEDKGPHVFELAMERIGK